MSGKGHEQEESPSLSPTPGTTSQLLSQLPPTPPYSHSISSKRFSARMDPPQFNKMQLLVKISSISLNHQTVKVSTPPLVLEVGLRSFCELSEHSPADILQGVESLYSIL